MNTLPYVLKSQISLGLPIESLTNIFLIDKTYAKIAISNYFWYLRFKRDITIFNDLSFRILFDNLEFSAIENWKELYKIFYKQTRDILIKVDVLFEFHMHTIDDIKKYDEMTKWFNDLFPDKQVYDYVFSLIAMCLLDKNTETVPILYGTGSNGKTVFLQFIKSVIDPYFDNLKIYNNTNDLTNERVSLYCDYYHGRVFHESNSRMRIIDISQGTKRRIKAIPCNNLFNYRDFSNKYREFKICFLIFILQYCLKVNDVNYVDAPPIINETTKFVFGL